MFNHFKKVTMLFFVAATLFCVSCDKDENSNANSGSDNNNGSLVGTTWTRSSYEDGYTFNESLFFKSDTQIEDHVKGINNGVVTQDYVNYFTYVYHAPRGTIFLGEGEVVDFRVDGNVLIVYDDSHQMAYTRQ